MPAAHQIALAVAAVGYPSFIIYLVSRLREKPSAAPVKAEEQAHTPTGRGSQ